MIKIPIAKHQQLRQAEEDRHDNAVYEIEKAKRLELAEIFGVKEELALATDKHGHWVSKCDIIDKHFKMLVQNESGDLVFSLHREAVARIHRMAILFTTTELRLRKIGFTRAST